MKKKKKSVPTAVQIRSVSCFQLLEGATGRQGVCQAQALGWAGWLPEGKHRELALQACTRAKFKPGRIHLSEPPASAQGLRRTPGMQLQRLHTQLYHRHPPHSDKLKESFLSQRKGSSKPRGITFLEDGEHYACSTAVNRDIHIPHKGFLLL